MNSDRSTYSGFFRSLVALGAAGVVLLAASASATAGTYSVYACQGPASQPLPNSSWTMLVDLGGSHGGHFLFGSTCGSLSVAANPPGAAMANDDDGARWRFLAPAGTTIGGYSLDRQLDLSFPGSGTPPKLTAAVREKDLLGTTEFGCVGVTADCSVAMSTLTRSSLSLSELSVGVGCAEASGCSNGSYTGASATLQQARVDVDDPAAPTVGALTGSLPNSFTPTGIKTVDVTASDVGGGVREITLAIDGVTAETHAAGGDCNEPFVLAEPCPGALTYSFSVDVGGFAVGVHTATATAVDAAGNVSAQGFAAFSIPPAQIPLPLAPPTGSTPVNGSPAVANPVAKMSKAKVTFSHGRKVTLSGRLTTQDGTPVAGAVLNVLALDLGVFNAAPKSAGTVTTRADGSFSLKVGPRGAKRYMVLFQPSPESGAIVVTSALAQEKLALSARSSAGRVRPGGSISISGQLKGAGAAAEDAPVEIDAKVAGRWRAVGVIEADRKGNYEWDYRFVRVKVATRFVFRAQVRRDASWPWPTVSSKIVKVLVAP